MTINTPSPSHIGKEQTITLSFQGKQAKLFQSKRESLLVVEAICLHGSVNRLSTGQTCLVHIRPIAIAGGDVFSFASELVAADSSLALEESTWASLGDACKVLVIRADPTIERNRKGVRIVECKKILRTGTDDNEALNEEFMYEDELTNRIFLKGERHRIFAQWLVDTYGVEMLSRGSGVLDVAGGNGEISSTLHKLGVPSTLLDPNPRCDDSAPFKTLAYELNGDGSDLTGRDDYVGDIVRRCSFICGMHPDQATEPILRLSLRLSVPFAVLPCCVMPRLFPYRRQKRHGDPVRSYKAFCDYLLDMAPAGGEAFFIYYLPFAGRNKVIFSQF